MKRAVAASVLAVVAALPRAARAQTPEQPPAAAATEGAPPPAGDGAPPLAAPPPAESRRSGEEPAPSIEVRVIGDKADALQKIPGSGTLVTAKEIQRAQPADVGEVLRRVPGLTVRQEEGGGLRLDVGVRGLDPGRARRVLVLEDGIPVAVNPYAESDLHYAPPVERMRGIEVVKGSGSILFGPQTIGGVINFLTVAPPSSPHAAVAGDMGQRGYLRALAQYGDGFEGARYVVQVFHKRGDGFREEAFHATDAFAKVAFETSERGEATVKIGFHDEGAQSTDVGLTREMFAEDPRRPTLAPADRVTLRRYEASLVHEQALTETTKLRTLLYAYATTRLWNRQDWDRAPEPGVFYERVVGDPELPGGAIFFRGTDSILDRSYEVAGVEPRLEQRFRTGAIEHTVDVGARLLVEAAKLEVRRGDTPSSTSGELTGDERHRTLAVAAYLQDRIAFREFLLVTPGVRVEHARMHREILRELVGGAPADVNVAGDSDVTGVIPGIGMVAGTPAAHVFAGLHVGWAPPRITTSVNAQGQTAELAAEESINYEIGTRLAKGRALRLEATGFLSSFYDQVVAATNVETNRTELTNAGQTRHMGVEAAASLGIGKLAALPLDVDVAGRYTLARAVFVGGDKDGLVLPYAPLQTGSVTLDLEHRSGPGAQIAWTHVSSQFTDDANTVATDATGRVGLIPSYDVIDVGARYRHRATGLGASITVKGLLDDVHVVARRPEGTFAAGFRQVAVGLRWDSP